VRHLQLRRGEQADVPAIVRLIDENLVAGHLLPRTHAEVERHAQRFLVIVDGQVIVACAGLAPLSLAVAEVRSLVVDSAWRGLGLGTWLVESLGRQARQAGFSTLCALTHAPGHFVRLGFSIVPHVWFPEKIAIDCETCAKFRVCGQHAVALSLDTARLDGPGTSYRRLPIASPLTLALSPGAAEREPTPARTTALSDACDAALNAQRAGPTLPTEAAH
jgi:amino-acid N-acetyltransferase